MSFLDVFKTATNEISGAWKSAGEKKQVVAASQPIETIWQAARAGDQDTFREMALKEGIGVVAQVDPEGNTPAHYAALTNQSEILLFIYSAVNETDSLLDPRESLNKPNSLGQTPIHWACVNGSIAATEFLLNTQLVDINQQDLKGCTPLITAAQYGQTDMCGYLMGRGAQLQICDLEGDNALHWAAIKGKADIMRLLIYSGFNPHQRDNYGQTPLHMAAISGDLNCVQDLCTIDNVEINVKDQKGKTPLMLAAGRRHEVVVEYLKCEIRRRGSQLNKYFDWRIFVFGSPGNKRGAFYLFILTMFFWAYPYYLLRIIPFTYIHFPYLNLLKIFLHILLWIFFVKATSTDPGYIPKNSPEYDNIIRQATQYDAWGKKSASLGDNPLHRLCHTCRCVKPLRSKHCRMCNRCVEELDHHCPYILSCVGHKNRQWFAYFVTTLDICAVIGTYLFFWTWHHKGTDVVTILTLFMLLLGLSVSIFTGSCLWYHALRNVTTNEAMNWKRYSYMQNARGHYRNPFYRGVWGNFKEFLHLHEPNKSEHANSARSADAIMHC